MFSTPRETFKAVLAALCLLQRVATVNFRGGVGPVWRAFVLSSSRLLDLRRTHRVSFFLFGLFCAQDVAVMGSPRLTEMNQGLRRLTRTHSSPLSCPVSLFDARELGGSLPGVRPQHRTLHGDQHGEKPQQQRQHQGSAPFEFYRPAAWRK